MEREISRRGFLSVAGAVLAAAHHRGAGKLVLHGDFAREGRIPSARPPHHAVHTIGGSSGRIVCTSPISLHSDREILCKEVTIQWPKICNSSIYIIAKSRIPKVE